MRLMLSDNIDHNGLKRHYASYLNVLFSVRDISLIFLFVFTGINFLFVYEFGA